MGDGLCDRAVMDVEFCDWALMLDDRLCEGLCDQALGSVIGL